MRAKIRPTILRGDRVAYAHRFLDDTGQFTEHDRGPAAPAHWGFNARGTVKHRGNGSRLCTVLWDDGHERTVLVSNLRLLKEGEA